MTAEKKSLSTGAISRSRMIIFPLIGISLGLPIGAGFYTFIYGKGYSYLSNDPKACINCHIMNDQYRTWTMASHHTIATCNDCHTPGNVISKDRSKASNGFWHSYAFTTQDFHEPIRIKPHNARAVEKACRSCHAPFLASSGLLAHHNQSSCIHCHRTAGHAQ